MENTGDITQPAPLTPEERLKIFNEVNNIFSVKTDTTIGMDALGRTDISQAVELISQLDSLDLSSARMGDIVWWLTKNSNNYFLVSNYDELKKELSGSFKSFKKDGEEGKSYDSANLLGATLMGTMLIPDQLKKGMSAEMSIPSENPGIPASNYSSSAIKELGIMVREEILPTTPTP